LIFSITTPVAKSPVVSKYRVLVLEDEGVIRKQLTRLLERQNYEVAGASNVEEALQLNPESFDLILADIRLPGRDGNDILKYSEQVPVIMMTSFASVRSAVESMKFGATNYISKPFDHDELLRTMEHALRETRVTTQNAAMRKDLDRLYPHAEMTSSNTRMQQTITNIRNLQPDDLFIYIQGERGTSKELLARICHASSDRNSGPLVFADLPMHESADLEELVFGTTSKQQRRTSGLLNAANGGTLVVTGIDRLTLEKQAKLTSLLLEAKSKRYGPDLRLIVMAIDTPQIAIQSKLLDTVLADQFRENVFTSPPLRHRREDIGRLSTQFLRTYAKRYRKRRIVLSVEAVYALQAYDWPGNLNELKSVIERAVLMVDTGEIKPLHLGINVMIDEIKNNGMGLSLEAYFRYFVLSFENSFSETELASKLGISRKALWERRQKMDLLRRA